MATKRTRSRVREQISRARSVERLNTRWKRATTPQGRCKAAMDCLAAYIAHSAPAEQHHMAAQLKDLAAQTRTTRPASHAWMSTRLARTRSPKRRAEIAMDCLKAYARHGNPGGVERIAGRLKVLAESTRTAR